MIPKGDWQPPQAFSSVSPEHETPKGPPQKAAGDSAAVSDRDADDPTPFPRVRACPREFAVQLRARNLRKSRVKNGVIYVGPRQT